MNYDPHCKYLRDWYQNQCFFLGDPRSEHYDPVKWCQFVINNPDPTVRIYEIGRDDMVEKCKEVILNYRINLLSQSKKENISNEGNYYIIFVLPIILLLLILVFYKKLNLKFFKSYYKKSSSKTNSRYRHEEKEFNTSYDKSTQFKDDLNFFDINMNFKKQELLNSRKKLLKENHPDRVNQMSKEIQDFAKEQTQRINEVYQRLLKYYQNKI